MELPVFNIEGKETGRMADLSEKVFALESPSGNAISLDVKNYLANQRQGTHKAKERSEVAFSTKKLYRQKGTGNARVGSRRSPIFRHGGRTFGPKPRNYGFKLNRKIKNLARLSALTFKMNEEGIRVLEDFTFDAPKTKSYVSMLENLQVNDAKTLLVLGEHDQAVYLSGRNVPKANVTVASQLNTYDILHADKLLLTEAAVQYINDSFEK